ncbi:hypothetical protein NE237_031533 [Protea cynaroides]|uniref:Uncharacterized protein n=1 Tax=Protea cynaroides TaxID=273540 RepID=A0A9Q0L1R6_9MAGN|nr:hypothetical protein NE237_031533 [Protea cynaroides]
MSLPSLAAISAQHDLSSDALGNEPSNQPSLDAPSTGTRQENLTLRNMFSELTPSHLHPSQTSMLLLVSAAVNLGSSPLASMQVRNPPNLSSPTLVPSVSSSAVFEATPIPRFSKGFLNRNGDRSSCHTAGSDGISPSMEGPLDRRVIEGSSQYGRSQVSCDPIPLAIITPWQRSNGDEDYQSEDSWYSRPMETNVQDQWKTMVGQSIGNGFACSNNDGNIVMGESDGDNLDTQELQQQPSEEPSDSFESNSGS